MYWTFRSMFALYLFSFVVLCVPWGALSIGTQWLMWPDDLGTTTLHLSAATRCRSLCLSLVSSFHHCMLNFLVELYWGFFFLRADISSPSLHTAPSCDSLCASVYRPQTLAASLRHTAWSPAPLLIFSEQSEAMALYTYLVDLDCVWLFDQLCWAHVW